MDVLVTVVRINARGKAQREQRRIAGPVLTMGRGSKSQIHLPDARVALDHARITVAEDHATVEVVEGAVEVNRRPIDRSRLAVGDVVEIGPYNITIEQPPAGVGLALAVSASDQSPPSGNMVRRVLLRTPRVSKRRLSYLAFFGVILLALIVPLASGFLVDGGRSTPGSARDMLREIVPVVADNFVQSWNPGPVSRGHQVFGRDCRACHQFAFLQVRDTACVSCHQSIKEHVPRADLTGVRGVTFAQTRCAECHRDHKGMQMAPRAQEMCADCHVDVKAAAPGARSDNVTDFVTDHPPFRVSLLDADRPDAIRRVRQATPAPAEMVERSNLKFNHALHLDPRGVRDPDERRTVMSCADCHLPEERGGRLIAPITMEKHCQRCHSLAFEPKVTSRQVPHGSEQAVMTVLREFYARLVLGDVPPGVVPPPDLQRMRPGSEIDYQERQQALRIADERAQRVLSELYETRDVCSTCHYVKREPAGYRVAPVRLAQTWMPQALFTHAKHATEACSTCHDVTRSTKAGDVAMPTVEKCRECHVGARAVIGKVTSDCATCHKFHAGSENWHAALQSPTRTKGKK